MRKLYGLFLFVVPAPFVILVNCGDSSSGGAGGIPSSTATTPSPTTTSTPAPTSTGTAPPGDSGGGVQDAAGDAARYCQLGFAKGDPKNGSVQTFATEGATLPTGHYRIRYVDGCMKYASDQSFTVHAYEPSATAPAFATWVLTNSDAGATGFQPVKLPGIWIYGGDAAVPDGGRYEACVELNKAAPPTEFDYDAGAPLGVLVNDTPLGDNTGGPDGGDPTWVLELYSQGGQCP
jgi:hypothetical protein